MAAYSPNYSFAQPPPGTPQQQPAPGQYGHQQQQSPYGQSPPPQYGQQPPQMQYSPAASQQSSNLFSPAASAPSRGTPRRSLSMSSAAAMKQEMALVSFDPYASTKSTAAAPPAYNNYSVNTPSSAAYGGGAPPSFSNEEMTTSPHSNAFGFAQQPQPQQSFTTSTVASDISMFSSMPNNNTQAMVPAAGTDMMAPGDQGEFSEGSVDPVVLAEQERIWQDIQDRRKMERIRADNGVPNPRAIIPHRNGKSSRQVPPRTQSMPLQQQQKPRSQTNSLARGGVAVLDPKKDVRKQTRKMKTAGGAVGGAVVGGLILGPVGVVLGAGGGAAVSNKMAKSRDKRKQAEFEQKNFQKGAANSVAAKGDGSFV